MFNKIELLAKYLTEVAGKPFVLGTSDCGLWLADWVILVRDLKFDPAVKFRNQYTNHQGWQDLAGTPNLSEIVDAMASEVKLLKTSTPTHCDIGVVDLPIVGQVGAIMGAKNWLVRLGVAPGEPGVARVGFTTSRVVTAWSV